jgi:hypothetical protein
VGVNTNGGWGKTRFKAIPTCHPERPHRSKGLCRECYQRSPEYKALCRRYYLANKEKYAARAKAYAEKGARARKYGLTPAAVVDLADRQRNVCAICGTRRGSRRLSVDHDHETGQVRGMLCGPCNMALGAFKDSPELCLKAAAYLRAYKRRIA